MKASLKMSLNNKYFVKLIDSRTGSVKQDGVFHNIATKHFFSSLFGTQSGNASHQFARIMSSLSVGSGTTEPAFTDTALANQLWTVEATSRVFKWLDPYTAQGTAVFVFPATTAYVGTITEVGLRNYQYSYDSGIVNNSTINNKAARICTRALLTDSEGQVISFNKTDIDILEVTVVVEVTLSSSDNSFKPVKESFWLRDALMGVSIGHDEYAQDFDTYYGTMNLFRYLGDMDNIRITSRSGVGAFEQAVAAEPTAYYDDTTAWLKYPTARLSNTVQTDLRFYKAIGIPSIGGWTLPNSNVLTPYTIFDIHVGVGDGATKVFENPMNYFKEGTEVLYKNGTALTRGTDYTINNFGNKDCLPEIVEMMGLPKVTTETVFDSTVNSLRPLFRPTIFSGSKSFWDSRIDMSKNAVCFSNAAPLLLEYDNAVTMNCLKSSAGFCSIADNKATNLPVDTEFYLDYSTDGVTYHQISSAKLTVAAGAFEMNFEDTTAKYWRLRTSYNGIVAQVSSSKDAYTVLTRKAADIVFTEAPADGDLITMSVDMDIIMKNSNFIVDLGCQLNFSL